MYGPYSVRLSVHSNLFKLLSNWKVRFHKWVVNFRRPTFNSSKCVDWSLESRNFDWFHLLITFFSYNCSWRAMPLSHGVNFPAKQLHFYKTMASISELLIFWGKLRVYFIFWWLFQRWGGSTGFENFFKLVDLPSTLQKWHFDWRFGCDERNGWEWRVGRFDERWLICCLFTCIFFGAKSDFSKKLHSLAFPVRFLSTFNLWNSSTLEMILIKHSFLKFLTTNIETFLIWSSLAETRKQSSLSYNLPDNYTLSNKKKSTKLIEFFGSLLVFKQFDKSKTFLVAWYFLW